MITIFTTAKAFEGETKTRQYNAIGSWKSLHKDIEVILFGSGAGYNEAVSNYGLLHIPDVELSEQGTPLVSSMFELASQKGKFTVQTYINCDIILMDDFLSSTLSIQMEKFLMVGQRWEVDVDYRINFEDQNWSSQLIEIKNRNGILKKPAAIDYFAFKRGTWGKLPPMVVGRVAYDNWLIYYCRKNGIPVIDATKMVMAIHQIHDYSHMLGGREEVWHGVEAQKNMELAGGFEHIFTIVDSNYRLNKTGMKKNFCRGNILRLLESHFIVSDARWSGYALIMVRLVKRCYDTFISICKKLNLSFQLKL